MSTEHSTALLVGTFSRVLTVGESSARQEEQDPNLLDWKAIKKVSKTKRKIADRMIKQKDFKVAREVYEQTLRALPAQSLEAAIVQRDLALLLRAQDPSLSDHYFQAALSSTASNPQFQVETHILLGKHLLKMRHFPAAEETLHQALHIASTLPTDLSQVTRVTFALGRCCEKARQAEKAVEFYEQGINTAKSSSFKSKRVLSKIMQRCASLHLRLGQLEKAEVMLKQLLEVNQSIQAVKKPYQMLTHIYKTTARMSDYQATKELLAQVYYLQPKNFNPVIMMQRYGMYPGMSHYNQVATDKLIDSFYNAHLSLPQSHLSAKALVNLAQVFTDNLSVRHAELALEHAIETLKSVCPTRTCIRFRIMRRLADSYLSRCEWDKAEPLYLEMLAIRKEEQNPLQIFHAFRQLGQFQERYVLFGQAEKTYKEVIDLFVSQKNPLLCKCYQVLGSFVKRRKRISEGMRCYDMAYECASAISSSIEQAEDLYNLGNAYINQDSEKAKLCYESAFQTLEIKAPCSWLMVLICERLLQRYKKDPHRTEDVHKALVQILTAPISDIRVISLLIRVLEMNGDSINAEKAYLKIFKFSKLKYSREELRAALKLADFYKGQNRVDDRKAVLKQVITAFYRNPHCSVECAQACHFLGLLYWETGLISETIQTFKLAKYISETHLPPTSHRLLWSNVGQSLDNCYRSLKAWGMLEISAIEVAKWNATTCWYTRSFHAIRNVYSR